MISERLNTEEAANVEKLNVDILATNVEKLHAKEDVNAKKLDTEQKLDRNRGKIQGNNIPK